MKVVSMSWKETFSIKDMPIGALIIKMRTLNAETAEEIIDFGERKGYIVEVMKEGWFLTYFKNKEELADFSMYLQVLKNPYKKKN